MCRTLWMFDFERDPDNQVHFDDFPIVMMVQKGPVKLRIKVRDGVQGKTIEPGTVMK